MLYFGEGGTGIWTLAARNWKRLFLGALDKLGPRKKVLVIPPDFTRFHSQAGEITQLIYEYYGDRLTDILPATGTHFPMTDEEIRIMYGDIPLKLFRNHDWRNDLVTLGTVPAEFVNEVSEGQGELRLAGTGEQASG